MKVANLLADLTTLNLAPVDAAQALVASRPGKNAAERENPDSESSGPDVARATTLLSLHKIFKEDFGSGTNNTTAAASSFKQSGSTKESLEEARASVREAVPMLDSVGNRARLEQQKLGEHRRIPQRASSPTTHVQKEQADIEVSHHDENAGSEEDELEAWS